MCKVWNEDTFSECCSDICLMNKYTKRCNDASLRRVELIPVSSLQCYLSQFNTVAVLPCPVCIWNKFWNSLSVFSRTLFRFNDSFFLSGSLHRRLYEYYTEVQFECAEYMELYGYEKMTFSQFVSTFSFQDGRLLWFDYLLESGFTGRAPKSRFRISIHSFRNYLFTSLIVK